MTIFVPDLPEFAPLIAGLERVEAARMELLPAGYWRVEAEHEIVLSRKALGLKPALWYSALSGGFVGRVVAFDRDVLRIVDEP